MARTAPVPNFPAIPGMNPGLFIMGGGGDGGGSGAGGGKGKGKGQGGDGKNGGNDANGGGKGAGSCGAGSGGGCPNPKHGGNGKTHAGDPVDVVTGRVYTLPQADMALLGPLVLTLERSYSSFARERDVGLGLGWSHSFAWSIHVRRRTLEIAAPFLEPAVYDLPPDGGVARLRDIGTLRMDREAPVLVDAENGLIHSFEIDPTDEQRYRLAAVGDRAGNRVVLSYDAAGLAGLIDSAGRRIEVKRKADGRIARFELLTRTGRRWWYRRYEHDDAGNLIAAEDAEGRRMLYQYDEEHRLTEQVTPSGQHTHFRYDRHGRCVETWVDYGGEPDPALAPGVPAMLADGETPAKGMLHVVLDYAEDCTILYDSRQTKRFDRNGHGKIDLSSGIWVDSLKYNASGDIVEYADGENHPERYERDDRGRLLAVTDATGATTRFAYDADGNLAAVEDALGHALRYTHDGAGNLTETADAVGMLLRCAYDPRGLRTVAEMPNGAVTKWEYDAEGNLVRLTEPHGKARTFEVDDVGRIAAFSDEEGYRTVFRYSPMNAVVSVTLPNSATHATTYDADGRLASYASPDGGVWRLSWGGYNCVHRLEKPSGEVLRFGYDREGALVWIQNERGEVHHIERDVAGRVVKDRFFDGREYRYRLDGTGRLSRHENGAGEVTEIERDASGRITKRAYTYEDTEERFEYDADGRLLAADNGVVACTWQYDARGNLLQEAQTYAGRTVMVSYGYNAAGQRTRLETNVGSGVAIERDTMGWQRKVHLGDGKTIERTWDGLGREVLRTLPEGGHVVCRYDGVALVERLVVSTARHPGAAPAWAGPLADGTTFAEGFACSPAGEVVEHTASDGSTDRYAYDPVGRVSVRMNGRGEVREAYAYEGTGRIVEPLGAARRYGPGGALLTLGDVAYRYDEERRRVEKAGDAGATRYEWNGRGMLAAVALPDGTRVENVYDTQGRRIGKTVRHPDGRTAETRFVWAGDEMIHELTWERSPAGAAPVRERAFVYDDEGFLLVQRETVWREGAAVVGPWAHAVRGPGEMPSLLVGGDGEIFAKLRGTVWGLVAAEPGAKATTPIRYPGQYADEETGLCYNRYRFYDPEVGLYISPDPVGLQGGLGAYEYAHGRPFGHVDPLGLQPVTTTITSSDGSITSTGHSTQHPNHSSPQGIHPIVWNALPDKGPYYTPPGAGGGGGLGNSYPGGRPPSTCGEPHALTNHIRSWEERHNGGQPLNPNDPRDRTKIQQCLGSIGSISSQHDNGTPRAPCPNCSQLLANLQARYGAPATSAIQPGYQNSEGTGPMTNFTPPHSNFLGPRRQLQP